MKKIIITSLLFAFGSYTSHSQNILKFSYDNAGNEINYKFPSASDQKSNVPQNLSEEFTELEILENKFSVSPNPTSGEVILEWQEDIREQIIKIELISIINGESKPVHYEENNSVRLNLTEKAAGLYMVVFYLDHPKIMSIQKKIIKY